MTRGILIFILFYAIMARCGHECFNLLFFETSLNIGRMIEECRSLLDLSDALRLSEHLQTLH